MGAMSSQQEEFAKQFACDYPFVAHEQALTLHADCLEWMATAPEASIHAIVTDPPYGVKEYEFEQLEKRLNGNGGVWRIPPAFDGNERSPLPRFTALSDEERSRVQEFFEAWGRLALRVLRPGGHLFLASNAFLSQLVFSALVRSGLEFRGEIIRLVRTLRGGNRPKNAEQEFPDVCSMPRGCYEPWGLFRKPLPPGMTVAECLRIYGTGGLRRRIDGRPFEDVIESERTPQREREIADHPSLKPQSFLRTIIYAALPLGQGIVLDPFMGSGSTIAAAEAVGYWAIGIERHAEYFAMSRDAIPRLAKLNIQEEQLELISI
ncbi:MAG: methyltransferase [Chloroflexota bacterium]|nr:MAG: methyltransferase [Chloroflexota bacterium]